MNDPLEVEYISGVRTKPLHISDWDAQIAAMVAENAENKRQKGWPKWKWTEHKREDPDTGREYVTRFVIGLTPSQEDVAAGRVPRMVEEIVTVYVPVNENGEVVYLRENEVVTRVYRQKMVDDLDEVHKKHKLRQMEHKLQKSKFTAEMDVEIAKRGADEETASAIDSMVSSAR